MGEPNKIKNLQKNMDLHEVIPDLVNQFGQNVAGERLGLSPSTINLWLKRNGYRRVVKYVRTEKAS